MVNNYLVSTWTTTTHVGLCFKIGLTWTSSWFLVTWFVSELFTGSITVSNSWLEFPASSSSDQWTWSSGCSGSWGIVRQCPEYFDWLFAAAPLMVLFFSRSNIIFILHDSHGPVQNMEVLLCSQALDTATSILLVMTSNGSKQTFWRNEPSMGKTMK